jgi:hypothetical protein
LAGTLSSRFEVSSKAGYLWAVARDDRPWGGTDPPAVVYAYAPGRGAKHAVKLLDGFARIKQLYAVEDESRGLPPELRRRSRQDRSKPFVEALGPWLKQSLASVPKGGKIGEALAYGINHWDGLTRYLDDGRIEIDSNTVERSIRGLALNRKNALFAGHDLGAENWATITSLVETCKLNAVDPLAWITDTSPSSSTCGPHPASTSSCPGPTPPGAPETLSRWGGSTAYAAAHQEPQERDRAAGRPRQLAGRGPGLAGHRHHAQALGLGERVPRGELRRHAKGRPETALSAEKAAGNPDQLRLSFASVATAARSSCPLS